MFAEEARKMSEGVIDPGTMQFKAKLCSLRERWNELFEKARMSESNAEQGLRPLTEYQEVFEEFTSRFEELEEKLLAQVPCFGSSDEVATHIEENKVLTNRESESRSSGTKILELTTSFYHNRFLAAIRELTRRRF